MTPNVFSFVGLICFSFAAFNKVACSSINCATNHIRLVGLESSVIGRLEVCYNSTWTPVCNNQWTLRNSIVACKMLGFEGTLQINSVISSNRLSLLTSQQSSDFHLKSPQCNGDERTLTECDGIPFHAQECGSNNEVVIYCTRPQSGDVRLVGPTGNENSGVVEIYNKQYGWSTVCTKEWTKEEANVVCRQLNYDTGEEEKSKYISHSLPSQHYNYFKCSGNESNLLECKYLDYFSPCTTLSRGAVTCTRETYCDTRNQLIISGAFILFGIAIVLSVIASIAAYTKYKNFKKPLSRRQNQLIDNRFMCDNNSSDAPPAYSEPPPPYNTDDTSTV